MHLARDVKEAQQEKKHSFYCDSPHHFIHNCPQLAGTEATVPLNQKEGPILRKVVQAFQGKVTMLRVSQDRTPWV